ncbi:MAG: acetyl-CoA carboxylase biotin carboxyl carrier protein [Melioribacteraceae bacterium]|nr:acetyl-CoA carboxylase biotin carboxyl carrier protein [Melioribacteraceae bacterium]
MDNNQKLDFIKKIIKVVEKSEITELSYQEGEIKLKVSKNSPVTQQFSLPGNPQFHHVSLPSHQPETRNESDSQPIDAKDSAAEKTSDLHEIKSPIVGTFYRSPAPDADPYVQIGDTISSGTVLCIVEAMKLMNEIESDINGKIVKILVENATAVEYNQPLFLIKKD